MATYYLNADTGDNANDGSSALPWETIVYAHATAAAGDTIVLQDSTATFTFEAITFTKSLTIQGEQTDATGAVIDGADADVNWKIDATPFTIEKLTIQNIIDKQYSGGILTPYSTSKVLNVSNVIFKDIAYAGFESAPFSPISGFIGCNDTSTLSDWTGNITNCLFNNITAWNTGGNAVMFGHRSSSNWTFNVTGCTFYFKPSTYDFGYMTSDRSNTGTRTVSFTNCIIYNTQGTTIADGAIGTYSYCCKYDLGSTQTTTNSITSDPLFVDVDNDNFNLRPTSPCIDTGTLI